MIKDTPSIRSQLILRLTIPLTALSLIALLTTSTILTDKANQVFDRNLLGAARSIEQRLGIRKGEVYLNMPYFTLDIMESAGEEKVFYRVERSDGELLAGFKGLAFPSGKNSKSNKGGKISDATPIFYSTNFAGNELRAVYLKVKRRGFDDGYVHINTAESLHSRNAFSNDILFVLAVVTLLSGTLSIIAAVLAVNQGLSPLRRIRQSILGRSVHDLAPLDEQVPKEVATLVSSINQLISRVRDNIEHIQRFNSDVSHQLRTPLAEMKTLAELAQQKSDPQEVQLSLKKIEQRTDFLVRTTQQLLNYAKTNRSLLDDRHLEKVDLTSFCRQLAMQLAPKIYQQGHELAFIPEQPVDTADGVFIQGDPVMLAGLLTNLIENSVLYATDSESKDRGTIIIRSGMRDQQAIIEVEDQGPGIPEHHLADVTQRFYRLDQQQSGSGLGLAIVQQISEFHQATMQLTNVQPHGLRVTISFKQ